MSKRVAIAASVSLVLAAGMATVIATAATGAASREAPTPAPAATRGVAPAAPAAQPPRRRRYPVRGVYDKDLSRTGFDHQAALGFNFIDSNPKREEMTSLARRGLKGFVWLGGYSNDSCTFRESDAWVREHVATIARSPAVGAYFIDDEPDAAKCPTAPAQMRERARLVRSIDRRRSRPTFLVMQRPEQLKLFARTVDVIGLDRYPCKVHLNGCDFSVIHRQAAEADRLRIRYWGVIQAHTDGYYKLPTAEELRQQFAHWRRTRMEGYLVFAWRWPADEPENWLANRPDLQKQLAKENARPAPRR